MTKVTPTLTNGRGFDRYGAALKLVISIYFFNGPIECKELIIKLALTDTLKNKKKFISIKFVHQLSR